MMSKLKKFTSTKKKGFTLIELLVVISILGILATLIVNNLTDARARARDAKRKAELSNLKTALRLYYNDNQSFPLDAFNLYIQACGVTGTDNCLPDTAFSDETGSTEVIYMKSLPSSYKYRQEDSGENFHLRVTLENLADEEIANSQDSCGIDPFEEAEFYLCAD